jgi:UDP-N-acetylmuramoyl-tripeptide--D-alanyl-D-alanine ligase
MLIGYMHYRKEPFASNKAYAFAAVAKTEGAEILYFSPGAVDGDVINGYTHSGGGWVRSASRLPDVIYNTAGFTRERQLEITEKLQSKIPFTSYSIGDKVTVYNNLMKFRKFADYLIPSCEAVSVNQLFSMLETYPEIILKPSWGRQGESVVYITKDTVTDDVIAGLSEKIEQETCILQPYINCRTKAGEPYDFRLHVQKGRRGEWLCSGLYPRISPDGSIVCNISRGGYTCGLAEFLKREFGTGWIDMQKTLEIFALQLASHLDEIQQSLYGEELDELGIDVGLDKNKKIHIYEVNWRPGHPPLFHIDLSIIRNTIHYAMFLAETKSAATRQGG